MSDVGQFKIIFVLGTPGAGKNTMCDRIIEKYQIFHFSCGDLLREAVQENAEEKDLINSYMKEGKIVPAKITCGLQKKTMIKNGKDYTFYLCDGFPRNEENLKGFMEVFGNECDIVGVLYLDCPKEEATKRILGRKGGRIDDNVETINKRFKVMEEETEPNLKNFGFSKVYHINAGKDPDIVFMEIDAVLKNLVPLRKK